MSAIAPIESTPLFSSEAVSGSRGTAASSLQGTESSSALRGPEHADSFGSILGNALDEANRADMDASRRVQALASGAIDDLHGTMISVKEAEIGIKLIGTVRNKVLDAFQELWRISV
jgi:flagellar hook-basal body complex protein FliE